MARLFISHSSANNAAAVALRDWLVEQGFENEVFLDIDPDRGLAPGERWQEALKAAADRCEAVLFLVSPAWLASKWCLAEFLLAKSLHKRIFGLIVEPVPLERLPVEMTAEWQLCELIGEDRFRAFDVEVLGKAERVEFREAGLDLLRRGIQRAGLDALSFSWPPPDEPGRAPYRGLKALEPQDAAIFFGRDAWIVRGLDRIRGLAERGTEKALIVLGASGSGKSSFLRAGLWPRLLRNDVDFLPLPVIRPQAAAISSSTGLAVALSGAFKRFDTLRPPGVMKEALVGGVEAFGRLLDELTGLAKRRLVAVDEAEADPIVILSLDQAEELFDPDGASEAATFLDLLAGVLAPAEGKPARRLLVVATMRSDRYELLQAEPRLESIKRELFDLPPMPQAEFKSVIEGPAQRVVAAGGKLTIDPALTERLIADAKGPDALPLLAFTLERLYADYGGVGRLMLADYEKLGGVQGSIEAAVAKALADPGRAPTISSDREAQLRALRDAFIPWLARIDLETGAPMRRVASRGEIPKASRSIVDRLVEARLLIADRRGAVDVVEVSHESLLRLWQTLAGWLEDAAADLRLVEGVARSASEWDASGRAENWLDHRGDRLTEAEQLITREGFRQRLGEKGLAYLIACRGRDEAERREREEALAREAARLAEIAAAQARTARLQRVSTWALGAVAVVVVGGVAAVSWQQVRLNGEQQALDEQMVKNRNQETILEKSIEAAKPPTSAGETVVDLSNVAVDDPGATLAALRQYGIDVINVVPAASKITLLPHASLYGDGAIVPTASKNFLAQTGTGNVPASFTLAFAKPLDAFSFRLPLLYAATNSGVTFPAWTATALDAQGQQLSSASVALFRSFETTPAGAAVQTYRLITPNFDQIAAVRFDSDPRLDGVPFAGFSAILIERMVLFRRN